MKLSATKKTAYDNKNHWRKKHARSVSRMKLSAAAANPAEGANSAEGAKSAEGASPINSNDGVVAMNPTGTDAGTGDALQAAVIDDMADEDQDDFDSDIVYVVGIGLVTWGEAMLMMQNGEIPIPTEEERIDMHEDTPLSFGFVLRMYDEEEDVQ